MTLPSTADHERPRAARRDGGHASVIPSASRVRMVVTPSAMPNCVRRTRHMEQRHGDQVLVVVIEGERARVPDVGHQVGLAWHSPWDDPSSRRNT